MLGVCGSDFFFKFNICPHFGSVGFVSGAIQYVEFSRARFLKKILPDHREVWRFFTKPRRGMTLHVKIPRTTFAPRTRPTDLIEHIFKKKGATRTHTTKKRYIAKLCIPLSLRRRGWVLSINTICM